MDADARTIDQCKERTFRHKFNVRTLVRGMHQRYTYRVLQTIQMKLILLCVSAGQVLLGSAKTALKLKYIYNSMYMAGYKLEK